MLHLVGQGRRHYYIHINKLVMHNQTSQMATWERDHIMGGILTCTFVLTSPLLTSSMGSLHPPWPSCMALKMSASSSTLTRSPVQMSSGPGNTKGAPGPGRQCMVGYKVKYWILCELEQTKWLIPSLPPEKVLVAVQGEGRTHCWPIFPTWGTDVQYAIFKMF